MDAEDKKDETEQGAKPEEKAAETTAPTIEELQKKIDELTRHSTNKEEEAVRVQKKLEAFEKDEQKRKDAQLTKEQLLEKRMHEAEAEAERVKAESADIQAKTTADADAKLLKAAFLLKAKDMGFDNPADAFMLADKTVTKKDNGDFDDTSIEAALKPLIGRLPVKAQGDGKGTPKLPPAPMKTKQKEDRAFLKTF